jgi:hypothetical protein
LEVLLDQRSSLIDRADQFTWRGLAVQSIRDFVDSCHVAFFGSFNRLRRNPAQDAPICRS